MQYQEFIERVQQMADLPSFEEAERVTQATLTTLGEYLAGYEGLNLADQLPQGLDQFLRQQPPNRSMMHSLNDFLQRVGEEEGAQEGEGVGTGEAEAHARAVMLVLEEAVSEGEMDDVCRQFPTEFDRLFGR